MTGARLTASAARILAAPLDSAVTVPASDLDGVNVFTLLNITATVPNFTVTFDVYRLPLSLQNNADKTLSVLYLMYNKSYDCVARPPRRPPPQLQTPHTHTRGGGGGGGGAD